MTTVRSVLLVTGLLVIGKTYLDYQLLQYQTLLSNQLGNESGELQSQQHLPLSVTTTTATAVDSGDATAVLQESEGKTSNTDSNNVNNETDTDSKSDSRAAASASMSVPQTPPPLPRRPPDGYFNTVPVHFNNKTIHSTVSCTGENFQPNAWMFRSCQFQNFCFDTDTKQFVIFRTAQQAAFINRTAAQDKFYHISTTRSDQDVSIGGINAKWRDGTIGNMRWFPQVVDGPLEGGYYELPRGTVWVPYHALAAHNPGHMVWDDFLSIYKLLSMFDKLPESKDDHRSNDTNSSTNGSDGNKLFVTRMPIKMWGDCEWNPTKHRKCDVLIPKFIPLMGIDKDSLRTPEDSVLDTNRTTLTSTNDTWSSTDPSNQPRSKYVCAKTGLAGLGYLTDHGDKLHGWIQEDYETTHNAGRGAIFLAFRNFVVGNIGVPVATRPSGPPYKVVISKFSSNTKGRVRGFGAQNEALRKHFEIGQELIVRGHRMEKLSLQEQAAVTSDAAVFVTANGGGAVTATFLPPGATLIVYYEATGGFRKNVHTGEPARLDWDLLNHASHLRVHWIPLEDMDSPKNVRFFVELVRNEIDIIQTHYEQ